MPPRFIRELIPRREARTPPGAVVVALKSLTWVQWAQFWSGSVSYLHCALCYYLYYIPQ
jgi:SHS family lactate transporter-like MFS transporter